MKKKIIVLGLLFVVLFFIITRNTSSLNSDFRGTFGSGEPPAVLYLSIDGKKEYSFADQKNDDWDTVYEFFYADQMNDIFLRGTFIQISDNRYRFTCTHPNDIIMDQDILYENKSFSFNISGVTRKFEKVGNLPTIYRDLDQYQ